MLIEFHFVFSREWNFPRSEARAQTDFSESRLSIPPEVAVVLLKPRDLPRGSEEWKDVHLPIDILLLTVKEYEFYSCLIYLNPGYYKSYKPELGLLYLGEMGDREAKLKVAVIQCNMGSTTVVPKAVRALRPKAVICVGFCAGLKEKKVKCGDVIISSKLATYAPTKGTGDEIIERGVQVPASPLLNGILKFADHGWQAPLKNPNDLEVEVHKDGLLLSGPEIVSSDERRKQIIKKYPQAIGVEMEDEGKISMDNDENCEVHAEFLQSTVMSLALHSLAPREYYYSAGQNSLLQV